MGEDGEKNGAHARTLIYVGGSIAIAVTVMWTLLAADRSSYRDDMREMRSQMITEVRDVRQQVDALRDYLMRKGEGK